MSRVKTEFLHLAAVTVIENRDFGQDFFFLNFKLNTHCFSAQQLEQPDRGWLQPLSQVTQLLPSCQETSQELIMHVNIKMSI